MSINWPKASPQIVSYADATIGGTDYTGTPRNFNIPNWQLIIETFQTGITTLTATIPNGTNIWSGSNNINIYFTKDQSFLISDLQIEMNFVVATSSIQFVPTDCFFNRVDISQGAVSGIIASQFPQAKMIYLATICTQGVLDTKLSESNYSYGNLSQFGVSGFFNPGTLPPLYYTLGCSFLNKYFGLYFMQAAADLAFNLFPATTIIASGSGTFTMPAMRLLVQTRNFNSIPGAPDPALENIYDGQATMFLNPITYLSSGITLGPGVTSTPVITPNFTGLISHIGVFIYTQGQSQNNTTNNELATLWWIGAQGTIDLQNAGGSSLLFNNTPVKGDYLRKEIMPDYADNSTTLYWNGCMILPITSNIINAYAGKISGCLPMSGNQNEKIVIVGSAAQQNEVWTVTKGSAAAYTAGYFSLFFYGQATAPVAYNGNVTTAYAAAFNAHPYCIARSITATFNVPLSNAAQTMTITLVSPRTDGLDRTQVQILPGGFTNAGGADQPTIARTTDGIGGIPSGTYDVFMVGLKYSWVNYYAGQLKGGDVTGISQLTQAAARQLFAARKTQIQASLQPALNIIQ